MKFECVKLRIQGIFYVRSNIEDYRDILNLRNTSSRKFVHVEKKANQDSRYYFNLVKKWKFYEKEDENDQGSDRDKMRFVFCGASCYFFSITGYSISF